MMLEFCKKERFPIKDLESLLMKRVYVLRVDFQNTGIAVLAGMKEEKSLKIFAISTEAMMVPMMLLCLVVEVKTVIMLLIC